MATPGLYIDTNTLQVGIGTTRPQEAFHVQGNLLSTGNITSQGTVTASNLSILGDFVTLNTITSNTEQMVIQNAGTGPALKVTQTGANSIAEFYDDGNALALMIADGGNVGIGTANPLSKLHVQGACIVENVGTGAAIRVTQMGANTIAEFYDDGNSLVLKIADGGNVGIGTVTPLTKLHVHGGVYLADGNVGIGTRYPRATLHVEGTFLNLVPLNGLEIYWDPSLTASYVGSGTFLDDVSGVTSKTIRGVLTNGPSYVTLGGGAFLLDGVDDSINTSVSFNLQRDWTIIMWVKRDLSTDNHIYLGHGTGALSAGLHVQYLSVTSIRYGFYGNDVDTGTTQGFINSTDWCQMAFTYRHINGLNRQIYQDNRLILDWKGGIHEGASSADATNAAYAGTGVLRIGASYGPGMGGYHKGYIGPVLIYNRVLNKWDVDQSFNYFRGRFNV